MSPGHPPALQQSLLLISTEAPRDAEDAINAPPLQPAPLSQAGLQHRGSCPLQPGTAQQVTAESHMDLPPGCHLVQDLQVL